MSLNEWVMRPMTIIEAMRMARSALETIDTLLGDEQLGMNMTEEHEDMLQSVRNRVAEIAGGTVWTHPNMVPDMLPETS